MVLKHVFLRWLMMSDLDIGGMTIEVKPSHQYSMTHCCCVADGSREGSLTQWWLSWKHV